MTKFIFVVGGVYSGVGKGIVSASICLLMKLRGYNATCLKLDGYLNINSGIIRPTDHGESFVTDSGVEADLDLGHYFRIADINVDRDNICTSGLLYKELIEDQEKGKWLGDTLQVIPHVTNKIIEKIELLKNNNDVVVVEIGGVIGDLESNAFYEAIRQFKQKYYNSCLIAMVSPILWIPTIKEFKTKPLQRSIRDLHSSGIQPDLLICRSSEEVPQKVIDKICLLTNMPREATFIGKDVDTIYEVPIKLYEQGLDNFVIDYFSMKRTSCKIKKYKDLVDQFSNKNIKTINVSIVGKYENCDEVYISLKESLIHAGIHLNHKINIKWIKSEDLEKDENKIKLHEIFCDSHAIIVPGGFDSRGIEGKITAIKFARENKIPYLGICLGLQCAVIEFARNVLNISDANSQEFDKNTKNPFIYYIKGQEDIEKKSATMRLGAYDCKLSKDSNLYKYYGKINISERHRHRLEVNHKYEDILNKNGFVVVGRNIQESLIEAMELINHPFFVGVQYHPEFKSSLVKPSPVFKGLLENSINYANKL